MSGIDLDLDQMLLSLDSVANEYGVLTDEDGSRLVVARHRPTGGIHAVLIRDPDLANRTAEHLIELGAKQGQSTEDLGWPSPPAVAIDPI